MKTLMTQMPKFEILKNKNYEDREDEEQELGLKRTNNMNHKDRAQS